MPRSPVPSAVLLIPSTHAHRASRSRRRVLLDAHLDAGAVAVDVLFKQRIRVRLRWALRIRLVEEALNAEENVFDCNRRLPSLVLVEDAQADRAAGVDVRMEECRGEFAFRRLGRVLVREGDCELEEPPVPDCAGLAGDAALPELEVKDAGRGGFGGFGVEAEGVVFAPLFAGLGGRMLVEGERESGGGGGGYRSSWSRFMQRDILLVGVRIVICCGGVARTGSVVEGEGKV